MKLCRSAHPSELHRPHALWSFCTSYPAVHIRCGLANTTRAGPCMPLTLREKETGSCLTAVACDKSRAQFQELPFGPRTDADFANARTMLTSSTHPPKTLHTRQSSRTTSRRGICTLYGIIAARHPTCPFSNDMRRSASLPGEPGLRDLALRPSPRAATPSRFLDWLR